MLITFHDALWQVLRALFFHSLDIQTPQQNAMVVCGWLHEEGHLVVKFASSYANDSVTTLTC